MGTKRKFMIVSGEPSGDGHAANLVRSMREIEPASEFFGAAGPKMRDAGVEAIVRSDDLSVVGLLEIGSALPMFLRIFGDLKRAAIQRKPDVVILVDFPEFNLKLARSLKKKGFRIVYYISPQLWAWRKYRVSTIKKYVDLMITILPFEKQWYAEHGVDRVEYVGNPLAREVRPVLEKPEFCRKHGIDADLPIVSMLPGSRDKEISRILPVMFETALTILAERPETQFVIAAANDNGKQKIKSIAEDFNVTRLIDSTKFKVVLDETYDALNASDAAAVTSGTATLETALIGTPMAVVYKTSGINYFLLKPLINVEHYGLVNLIAEQRVAVELIQNDLTPMTLSTELLRLLEPNENSAMREKLKRSADKLGAGGASMRAAKAIRDLMILPMNQ
ncbi:MAG: lipid-A-disaccharide synthase [Acidobacteria bacterium]|nr:lipid-A-disaccharide synthase [Acidobacteriota bacterium]